MTDNTIAYGFIACKGLTKEFIQFYKDVMTMPVTIPKRKPYTIPATLSMKKICLICGKKDPTDSKDGIPIHKTCWETWVKSWETYNKKHDPIDPAEALHDIKEQIEYIKQKSH